MQSAKYRLGNYTTNNPVFSGGKMNRKGKTGGGTQKGNEKEALNLKILKRYANQLQ